MKLSLLVVCEKCGYENFPQHRYCGMCGAELPPVNAPGARPSSTGENRPAPIQQARPAPLPEKRPDAQRESAPQPLNGPSFLGLGNAPSDRERLRYLLEDDEESTGHRGAYAAVVFLLFVAALGLATWRWRPDLFSRFTKLAPTAGMHVTNAPAPASSPSTPVSSSEGSPSDQSAATGPQASPSAASSGTGPSEAPSSPAASSTAPPAATPVNPATPAPSQPAASETTAAAQPQEPPASQPPAEKPTAKPTRAAATSEANAEPAAAPSSEALEAEGEKYLYGNGVPENCGRAQRDLLAAANHNSAKAQSVLGTMYATGHCTGRDLPLAYHWFGRALRQDPSNTRIEQDLKALWNQMTPEERNIALRSEQ